MPPAKAPEPPPASDVLWAATNDPLRGSGKLYRLERGCAWEECQP